MQYIKAFFLQKRLKKMSRYTYILDNGHGGLINGKYQTSGKRSPKFPDGSILYEGVNNRDNVKRICEELTKRGIDHINLIDTQEDVSLADRVYMTNQHCKDKKCIFISVHSNAAGSGGKWANAQGNGVYLYLKPSQTSTRFGHVMAEEIQSNFSELTKFRGEKNRNFYVLRKTKCPAILLELGFHDNLEEAQKMLTEEWKKKVVKSVCDSIEIWEKTSL